MSTKFDQNTLHLIDAESKHKLKISKLMELIAEHPYREDIEKSFHISEIEEEYIVIDFIDVVFRRIKYLTSNFHRFSIKALIKDISIQEHDKQVEGIEGVPMKFIFDDFKNENDEELNALEAFALYDSKNAFLGQYDMSKYANRLYKNHQYELLKYNVEYFKHLAASSKTKGTPKSYRLLEHNGDVFLRGITSVNQYNEYGVDFAFVVAMLIFHNLMKENPGDNYKISSVAISASKIEFFVMDKAYKEAKGFGKVSSTVKISTNDLGNASFKFLNVIKVGIKDANGFYIFPKSKSDYQNELKITHNTMVQNAMQILGQTESIIRSADDFIEELGEVKGINTPDELRSRILFKLENKNSAFKGIKEVKDLFRSRITNSLENFTKLLEMCRKAEELDITYDLKDKLRYIISDILLNHK